MISLRMLIACTLTATIFAQVVRAETRPFGADSLRDIEQHHAGNPFIVVLWASDCTPCLNELEMLRSFVPDHPEVSLVLVSGDAFEGVVDPQDVLAKFELANVESWAFSDLSFERIQFNVDPDWVGELPRSYLYDGALNRITVSGTLTISRLEQWLESIR